MNIFKLFRKKPNVLVLVGGNKNKIDVFNEAANSLGVKLTTASFSEISYESENGKFVLRVNGVDISDFTHIYIRMVGKRLEDASLVANYAKDCGIKIFDILYSETLLMPSSLGKSIEMMKLIKANVSFPKTYFSSVADIRKNAIKKLGFPLVVKSTSGKKAREVWSPNTRKDLKLLLLRLEGMEKEGMRFFAQEFIPTSERTRVFVIGERAVAAIVRPTKWRKRVGKEGRKMVLSPIPEEYASLAVKAAKSVGLQISGVDIVKNEKTGELFVLEANAAPVWKALAHDTKTNIEVEILKYIISK